MSGALRRALEVVGLLLSVLALLFAIQEFRDSKQQISTLETIGKKVELAADGASTKYIGAFPDNLPTVTEVVQQTCENLDIMADVAGYG